MPAVLSCLQPAAGARKKPKLVMIVPFKIFSAIGAQELPEVKVGSQMGFYSVSSSAVTGDLQSGVTTGTTSHHSVAEILIIIKQFSLFD